MISFVTALLLIPWWIRHAKRVGLVGTDMHKTSKKKIAEVGGLPVVAGFLFGLLLYVGHRTFIQNSSTNNTAIIGVVATILIVFIIGLIDDILGWKLGLRQWQKPLLTLFAALPVMMTNIGKSLIVLPLVGEINLGIFYPLIFVPIWIAFSANAFNMLGGYNGLEAGMGIIILSALGFIIWLKEGLGWVAMIAFAMVFALAAFMLYNRHPARVFPGDTLTYSVGALIAMIAILGNTEKVALFLMIPYGIQVLLKLRGRMQKESFAKVAKDGSLTYPTGAFYALEHVFIAAIGSFKKKVGETDVVLSLYLLEILLVVATVFFILG